jgi:hypothetical protein
MKLFFSILLSFIFCLSSCKKKTEQTNNPVQPSKVVIGFNQNWSFFPAFNATMLSNINQLKPQMIRYPGGTVAHDWDWVAGRRSNAPATAAHPVADIQSLATATNVKMIFVLDIVNRSITDQIAMLNAIKNLGVSIDYVELGNELYANDAAYITAFPTGTDYATKANQWIPQIRAAFPNVKIAALLQCRNADASNQRFAEWNNKVVSSTSSTVDAYTYHIYIPVGGSFASRKADYEAVANATNTGSKELWITEYGNQNDITDVNYYKSLDSLANYVEAQPKITIALNHLIVGNNKNKLTSDGLTFTQEGQLFLTRASKR